MATEGLDNGDAAVTLTLVQLQKFAQAVAILKERNTLRTVVMCAVLGCRHTPSDASASSRLGERRWHSRLEELQCTEVVFIIFRDAIVRDVTLFYLVVEHFEQFLALRWALFLLVVAILYWLLRIIIASCVIIFIPT